MASTEHVPSFAELEYDTPLYRTAIAQFDQAVPYADVDPGVAERLRHPGAVDHRRVPDQARRRDARRLPGLPRPALERDGARRRAGSATTRR